MSLLRCLVRFVPDVIEQIFRYTDLRLFHQAVIVYFFIPIMNSGAERFNGLMAMLGIVAGIGAYATTGQIIPGIF